MPPDLVNILIGFAGPPVVGHVLSQVRYGRARFYLLWSTSATGGSLGAMLPPAVWVQSCASAASLALALICWWLSRRRRKRAPKLAGAKSKALLAAVVRVMRERAKSGPVFRPQRQGV